TVIVDPPDPSKRLFLASTRPTLFASPPARLADASIVGFGTPGRIAVGARAGDRPPVRVFHQATGTERFRFYAYPPPFTRRLRPSVRRRGGRGGGGRRRRRGGRRRHRSGPRRRTARQGVQRSGRHGPGEFLRI